MSDWEINNLLKTLSEAFGKVAEEYDYSTIQGGQRVSVAKVLERGLFLASMEYPTE
jgi:hypothetical protein